MSPSRSLAAMAALALLGACATGGGVSIPINEYQDPPPPPQTGYVIQTGDILQVRVFNQPDMSARVRVREDGKVSIPFLNDVTAVGLTPNALAQQTERTRALGGERYASTELDLLGPSIWHLLRQAERAEQPDGGDATPAAVRERTVVFEA